MEQDTVIFIDYNTSEKFDLLKDFGFFINDIKFGDAVLKKNIIEIPCSSNYLDFSDCFGDVNYNLRKIYIYLNKRSKKDYLLGYSKLQNCLHGKKFKIINSKDKAFYWVGRVEIGEFSPYPNVNEIIIECEVEPFKYDLNASNEDWEWDPFDFECGIINETKELLIDGSLNIVIWGRRKKVVPKFICENPLQLIFKNNTYNLPSGTCYIPDVEIEEGKNTLKFIGSGTATIEYRGGSL